MQVFGRGYPENPEKQLLAYHKYFRLEFGIVGLALFLVGLFGTAQLFAFAGIARTPEYPIFAAAIGGMFIFSLFTLLILITVQKVRYRFPAHVLIAISLGEIVRVKRNEDGPIVPETQRPLRKLFRYLRISTNAYRNKRSFLRIEKKWLSDFQDNLPILKEFVLTVDKKLFLAIEPELNQMSESIRIDSMKGFATAYAELMKKLEGQQYYTQVKMTYLRGKLMNRIDTAADKAYMIAAIMKKFLTPIAIIVGVILGMLRLADGDLGNNFGNLDDQNSD